MNVLLITAHSIAAYDDVRMLTDLGYDVFNLDGYIDPAHPHVDMRPALPDAPRHPELMAVVDALGDYDVTIATDTFVAGRADIPDADTVLLDLTPAQVLAIYPCSARVRYDEAAALLYQGISLTDKFTFNIETDDLIVFDDSPETLIDALIEMAMYLSGFATMMGNDDAWVTEFAAGAWKPVKNRIKRQLDLPVSSKPRGVVGLPPAPDDGTPLFAHRGFVRLWFARMAGVAASQMLMVAVAWQMYDLTGSAWDLGLVGLFQFVPALLMTLPAGHAADRLHRGRIFAACMLIQAMVAVLLVAATQGGFATRELILGISVMLGITRSFQMPAFAAAARMAPSVGSPTTRHPSPSLASCAALHRAPQASARRSSGCRAGSTASPSSVNVPVGS